MIKNFPTFKKDEKYSTCLHIAENLILKKFTTRQSSKISKYNTHQLKCVQSFHLHTKRQYTEMYFQIPVIIKNNKAYFLKVRLGPLAKNYVWFFRYNQRQ